MKARRIVFLVASALMTASTGFAAQSAQAAPGLGADCAILGPIGSNAISTLAPLQNEPQSQAAPQLNSYLSGLRAKQGSLSTTKGRSDLDAYIHALANANSKADAPQILAAINQMQTDCPS